MPHRLSLVILGCLLLPAAAQIDRSGPSSVPVYIEDSPAAQELLEEARKLRGEDRLAQAVQKYQQVIDDYAAKLMQVAQGRYTDAARRVRMEIADDPALLEAYRRYQQPPAARALEEALTGGRVGGDVAALETVAAGFTLTEAGLGAALRLASLYLEHAAAVDAQRVLDEFADHPDLPAHRDAWLARSAAAALVAGRAELADKWRAELNDAAEIDALAAQLSPPAERPMQSGFDPAPIDDWPRPAPQPLWQVVTDSARDPADFDTGGLERVLPELKRLAAESVSHFMVPLVDGDRIYINDSVSVAALDRSSGRILWSYALSATDMPPVDNIRVRRNTRALPDQRSLVADGSLVCGVVGRGALFPRNWGVQAMQTWLVGLSRDDGSLQWQVTPGEVDETLERAYFHGTPLIDQGRVYALVRRSQMSGFHGAFIIAVDARSGETLWRRHLSSAAPGGSASEISLTQMRLHRGKLYVADNLGSVACLDGRSGSVYWMTIAEDLPAPQRQAIIHLQRARVMPMVINNRPIMTEAGLIVPSVGGTSTTWVVNPQTGVIERELEDDAWAEATYVLEIPGEGDLASGIITVGESVRCFDGKTLKLRWRDNVNQRARLQPRGRPAVTQRHVVLPMTDHLIVLDLETGESVDEPRIESPGNLLLTDDQLLIAGSQTIFGHMQWDRAYALIAQQIDAEPTSPSPGMAMAHLALGAQRWDALIEGVDAALAAVRRMNETADPTADLTASERAARKVFEQIRTMIDPQSDEADPTRPIQRAHAEAMSDELRGKLFDRLADAAVSPADVVAYRLALGRDLERRDMISEAVDQYQAILIDPDLASQHVKLAGGSHQASLEAAQRLRELVSEHPLVYAQYQAMAADRMAVLTQSRMVRPDQLIELAQQFPLSATAASARTQAASMLAEQGRFAEAIVQLHRAYAQADNEPLTAQIVGSLVTLYEKQGQSSRARQWLRRARREHPALRPLREGEPVLLDVWLAQLSDRAAQRNTLPHFEASIDRPFVLEGALLLPRHQPTDRLPRDLMVLKTDDALELRGGPKLEALWSVPLADDNVELVSLTPDQALFWFEQTSTLLAVDARTGVAAWRYDHVDDLIAQITGDALTMQQRRFRNVLNPTGLTVRNQRIAAAVPDPPEGYIVVANEMVACISDRAGRALAMDRHSGQILWRKRCPMEQINRMAIDDDALAVAGTSTLPLDSQDGHVALYDPFTGEEKLPVRDERSPIVWMNFPGGGMMQYATASTITMIGLDDGRQYASVKVEGRPLTDAAVADTAFGVFHTEGGSALVVDLQAQKVATTLEFPAAGRAPPARIRQGDDVWFLGAPWHASAWSRDGRLLWRDAVGATRSAMVDMLLSEKHVAVIAQIDPGVWLAERERRLGQWEAPILREAGGAYRLYLLDQARGVIVAARNLPPVDGAMTPWGGLQLDHFIAIAAGSRTVVVPDSAAAR